MKRNWSNIIYMKINNKNNQIIKLIKIITLTLAIVVGVFATNQKQADAATRMNTKQTVLHVAQRYYRWDKNQQYYIDRIITRESGWNLNARNGRYYGLFQTTNVYDKSVMGQSWQGFNYIRARYGNPAKAWQHVLRTGWY